MLPSPEIGVLLLVAQLTTGKQPAARNQLLRHASHMLITGKIGYPTEITLSQGLAYDLWYLPPYPHCHRHLIRRNLKNKRLLGRGEGRFRGSESWARMIFRSKETRSIIGEKKFLKDGSSLPMVGRCTGLRQQHQQQCNNELCEGVVGVTAPGGIEERRGWRVS